MESTLVVVNPAEFGLELTEAQKIEVVFTPMISKMVDMEKEYNEIVALPINDETIKKAKELRLRYVKVRTGTQEIHKTAKAYYLAGGRFVDAWKNAQEFASVGKEKGLEKIEKHNELIEQEKKEKSRIERSNQLAQYVEDVNLFNLKEMSEAGFQMLLANSKFAHESRVEAEKKAETERLAKEKADKEEQERIRVENERLKVEAKIRDEQMATERAKAETDRLAAEAVAKIEIEARLKLEDEVKELARLEEEKKAQELEAKRQQERAPDKDKLMALADTIDNLSLPELTTEKAKLILKNVKDLLTKVSTYTRNNTKLV